MTIEMEELLPIILYLALIVFVITLIVLVIKLIGTLGRVDKVLDDVNSKMTRVDGLFDVIDRVTDYATSISDKVISGLANAVHFVFGKLKKKKSGLGKFIAGVAIGTGIGVLFAPKKGSETRAELKEKMQELYKKAKELDMDEVKENIEIKIAEIKASIEDLDKEKVISIAKSKAKKLQDLGEELVDYVVEKGTPVMEKTATAVRDKTNEVCKEVLDKLKKKEKEALTEGE